MKRLVVCNDGTWNTPDQEDNGVPAATNVFKLYNAVAAEAAGVRQERYYHPGVGGEGGVVDAVLGGALGVGISRNIQSAYHWLASHYAPGDEIYLFGFSRGAFTARSIGGFLGRGLLDISGLAPAEAWRRVKAAYEAYREKGADRANRGWVEPGWRFFHDGGPAPVRFIGVWDTVGALGIPDDLEFLDLLFERKDNWRFHDADLGGHVATGRHAMAIDEVRSSFTVTRWSNADRHPDVQELWFPGVHCDVGGGYAQTDLSDGALAWMIGEAERAGLGFRPGVLGQLAAKSSGIMHNSFKRAFSKLRSRPRNVDAMTEARRQRFHASALERQAISPLGYPAYRPTRQLAVGESATVDVFADTHWNDTGLYLDAGEAYVFSASGEWQDSKDTCDWRGTEDDNPSFGDALRGVGSLLGRLEGVYARFSDNRSTDFLATKRVEKLKWFVLVGAIANDAGSGRSVANDGSPSPHQYVALPDHETEPLVVASPGYLYCFPNDVWSLYGNNHGSIGLTVTRTG